jgi:GntR family transcriptional regulator/MocR family aminotransferase
MDMPLLLDGTEPIYRQIYHGLREAIDVGRLAADDRLPSSRQLAGRLGVSRNVVLLAYAQLEAEGCVVGRPGSGTYVARDLPERRLAPPPSRGRASPEPQLRLSVFGRRLTGQDPRWTQDATGAARWDFTVGRLAPADFPDRDWQRALRKAARSSSPEYAAPEGLTALRRLVLRYLTVSRGVVADLEQVVITNGMRQGYDLTLRLLVDPGAGVVLEEPGFPPVAAWTAAHGARVVPVDVDADGLRPDSLSAIEGARLAYLTPSHQFPTGAILSMPRRVAVLDWARQAGCALFEDDYDAEFQYAVRPIPALQGLAPGSVIYAGSVAKVLSPALRIGYLVVPRGLVDAFRAAKRGADRQTSTLLQQALACFMADGSYERHLRRQRARYRARREALVAALEETFGGDVLVRGVQAGVQVLVSFPELSANLEPTLVRRAESVGVRVEGAGACYASPATHSSLLLGFAAMSEAEIGEGIRRLARVVADLTITTAGLPRQSRPPTAR